MAMPYGVVIKTPPAQFSTLWHPPTIDKDIQAEKSEQCATNHLELSHDFSRRSDDLGPLVDVASFRHNCYIAPAASSAQLLRNECPINEFITMLCKYHKSPEYRELPESS